MTTTSWAAASPRSPARQPSSRASASAALDPRVGADARPVAGGRQAASRPGAVHPAADHPDRSRALARPAPGPRPPRPRRFAARSPTSTRSPPAPRPSRRRRADRAAHHRQAPGAVARERGHPLEQRQPVAARRHRPEVAVRRAVEVDLRRHHPLAARVALERLAGCARSPWRDRPPRAPPRRRSPGSRSRVDLYRTGDEFLMMSRVSVRELKSERSRHARHKQGVQRIRRHRHR